MWNTLTNDTLFFLFSLYLDCNPRVLEHALPSHNVPFTRFEVSRAGTRSHLPPLRPGASLEAVHYTLCWYYKMKYKNRPFSQPRVYTVWK